MAGVEETGPQARLELIEEEVGRMRERLHKGGNTIMTQSAAITTLERDMAQLRLTVYGPDGILTKLAAINTTLQIAGCAVIACLLPILVAMCKMAWGVH